MAGFPALEKFTLVWWYNTHIVRLGVTFALQILMQGPT